METLSGVDPGALKGSLHPVPTYGVKGNGGRKERPCA